MEQITADLVLMHFDQSRGVDVQAHCWFDAPVGDLVHMPGAEGP